MDCGSARGGTSHTPVHPWNLRSPCRRERPSVQVKATLQRDNAICERPVASDDLPYKSNEFGLLPINPIVRNLTFQIRTGIDGSRCFLEVFFYPELLAIHRGCRFRYDLGSLTIGSRLPSVRTNLYQCNHRTKDGSGQNKFLGNDSTRCFHL